MEEEKMLGQNYLNAAVQELYDMIKEKISHESANVYLEVIEQAAEIKEERFGHKGAANYLGIADQTLYNWRTQGRGPDYVLMGSKIIYLKSDLDKFIELNKIKLNS